MIVDHRTLTPTGVRVPGDRTVNTEPRSRHEARHLHVGIGLKARRPDHRDLYSPTAEARRRAAMTVEGLSANSATHEIAHPGDRVPARPHGMGTHDVLHLHAHRFVDLGPLAGIGLSSAASLVVHLHEHPSQFAGDSSIATNGHHPSEVPLARLLLRRAQLVVASTGLIAELASRAGAREVLVPAPAPLPVAHGLHPWQERPAPWLWGRRIVVVEPFVAGSRIGDLIEALAPQPADTDLILLGDGPAQDTLRQTADQLALGHRVHVGHRPTWAEVDAHLRHADIVATTSVTDSGPYALLHAMQLGRPIVAADTQERRRFISGDVDGVLVPPGHRWTVAGAIRQVLTDTPLAEALGAAAARRAASRGWSDVGREILDCLDE